MSIESLQFLESAENVKRRLLKLTGREPSTNSALQIAACIRQGRQFYMAAGIAPLEIRPLVQFYGFVGFAKALILARSGLHKVTDTLHKSHGLRDISPSGGRLEELTVRVESKGTFVEFNDAVRNFNRVIYTDNGKYRSVNILTATSEVISGSCITLRELIGRQPMLQDLYKNTFDEPAASENLGLLRHSIVRESDSASSRACFSIVLHDASSLLGSDANQLRSLIERWRERFPYLRRWRLTGAQYSAGKTELTLMNLLPGVGPEGEIPDGSLKVMQNGDVTFATNPWHPFPEVVPLREALEGVGGGFSGGFLGGIEPLNGKYWSEFSISYATLFLLSSLVRYRPHTWAHAVSGRSSSESPSDDQMIALIESFLRQNSFDVPEMIENTIDGHGDPYVSA